MRAIIISNGDIKDYSYTKNLINKDDYIICADGAMRHCLKMDILPDVWLGDFDSCNFQTYLTDNPFLKSVETVKLNPQKDVTDTHAACDLAIKKGYKDILILGALGTRFDHTLSNIHLLEYLFKLNVSALILNENNILRVFDSYIKIKKSKKYLSLLPFDTDVVVKKTNGLKYFLENYKLDRSVSLGVSNEILSDEATIEIEGGLLLIIESDD